MQQLMKFKLSIKKFVGKNDSLIMPMLKFLMTFIVMSRISSTIGYMGRLASLPVTLIISLAASFLPVNLTLVIIAFVIVAHLYSLSMEVALVVFALFLVLFLLYFRFASKDAIAVMITPIAFMLKIPYVVPVSMGLVGTPSSMVSVGSGVVVYEVLHYIANNAEELGAGGESKLGAFKAVVDAIVTNKQMIVYVVAFAVTVLVVYIIRKLSIKYAWQVAIIVGALTLFFVTIIANVATGAGISFGGMFLGIIVATLINFALQYFLFDLDYNTIEKVQFEDDEYYYYVKAVPKNEFVAKNAKKRRQAVRPEGVRTEARPEVRRETSYEHPDVERKVTERTVNAQARLVSERPMAERPQQPMRRPVEDRPVQVRRPVSSERPVSKGPLGMSGGRPAGEGRRLKENE